MSHKLDQHYSDFGGMDTRSNKLLQNVRTQRNGSKNYRYNSYDEYQQANGLQHRIPGANIIDIFEYKYRDVNTGQSKFEILSVQTDGRLYKSVSHTLEFLTTGAATSYSFYYDEVLDSYKFVMNGLGEVAVSDTMTLEQLRVALNLLAGVSVRIVDQFGDVTTSSTQLAYTLQVLIENDFQDNEAKFWTVIPYPDMVCTTVTQKTEKTVNYLTDYTWTTVPFPTTVKAQDAVTNPEVAENYEGISSTNINNSIYITDGGFMMKYDGKVVYRAGVPHLNYQTPTDSDESDLFREFTPANIANTTVPTATATDLPVGIYYYDYRYGFTDYSGATNYGIVNRLKTPWIVGPEPVPMTHQYFNISIGGMVDGGDFPVFAAKVNGDQGNTTGLGITLLVDAGHNILPGMIIRQEVRTANTVNKETRALAIGFYAKVVSVNNTGLVLQSIACTAGDLAFSGRFDDNSFVNGYYTQEFYESKVPDPTQNPPGFFVEIYRTRIGQTNPRYLTYRAVLPKFSTDLAVYRENKADNLIVEQLTDADPGGELPKAGKYITSWQSVITQAGLPPDSTLAQKRYPTAIVTATTVYCQPKINDEFIYTVAFMCDYQTIYYADILTPEGFPLDGLHEFAIDSQFSDKVKGIAQNKDALFAFKERSTGILTGDIGTNELVLEILEDDIGCASHKTIEDVFGSLVWLDKTKGFYSCVAGRLPVHIGYPISDYQQTNSQKLDYSTAAAANFKAMDLYICVVGSTWFVLDYSETGDGRRNCWYIWERFNATSILNTSGDDNLVLGSDSKTWQIKATNTKYDFTDHKSAIEMDIRSAWLNYNLPTVDKSFSRIWINSIQGEFDLDVDFYANYREPRAGSKAIIFGDETRLTVKDYVKDPVPKISALSVGFRNQTKNQFVRIQGWEVEYSNIFDPGEPKR